MYKREFGRALEAYAATDSYNHPGFILLCDFVGANRYIGFKHAHPGIGRGEQASPQ
jgi:hypothetical protein